MLMTPTVHRNGTSKDGLIEPIAIAYSAVGVAIRALQETAPNARDYYVQGPDAFSTARREHEARMHKLADVARELLALHEAIDAQ